MNMFFFFIFYKFIERVDIMIIDLLFFSCNKYIKFVWVFFYKDNK